ncbi:thioredoxin-like protein YusE [Halobacillus andaensis]|uniref:Thioredoxin-like protein YusE n=1 Tax=Halobacillus andaensis TaxID=1176239 RepID=A0A917EYJ5_HALAA|nr:thioredoxin family protein [Halobacillus andaensis]MBP2005557.1 thioredoxin-like negative regulator of GroEL [Halobacillus andaensis]GGF32402.1 thioredoxin-like protein YusE [Halobacillus andaensis]
MQVIENQESFNINDHELALIYIYTPFCGTCRLARTFLEAVEHTIGRSVFYELNASLHPEFMQEYQIKSVPCLLITKYGQTLEKTYAFHSVSHMYEKTKEYV